MIVRNQLYIGKCVSWEISIRKNEKKEGERRKGGKERERKGERRQKKKERRNYPDLKVQRQDSEAFNT